MYIPQYAWQFKKDLKRIKKQGKKIEKLKIVLRLLITGEQLPFKYKDHSLKGGWIGFRDLHIEPDWLLIYKIQDNKIRFERTGSHSDLFNWSHNHPLCQNNTRSLLNYARKSLQSSLGSFIDLFKIRTIFGIKLCTIEVYSWS